MPEDSDASGPHSEDSQGEMPRENPRRKTGAGFAGETTGSFSEFPVDDSSGDETVIAPAGSGNEIIGDYEILGKLGQGGMGAVYRARQISLHRQVALKILPANLEADDEFVARFQREARTAASLNHENIVKVYASGFVDGSHYIAMELIEGETLGQFLKRSGALEPADALRVTRDVALALQCGWNKAHLIHRDIKPGNIFLSEEGEVKVGDLGLARSMANDTTGLTQTGTAMGTPNYISPEQAKGERDLDFRADIYSLGCTLFQMLTGRTPYTGADPMSVMHQHIHGPPPAILKVLPQCPIPLARLVGKMLKKIKRERQASYEELLAEIEKVQALYAPAEDATLSAILPPDADATMTEAPPSSTPAPSTAATVPLAKTRSKIPLYAGLAAGILVLAGIAMFAFRPKPPEEKLTKAQLAMQQREAEEAARRALPPAPAKASPAQVDVLGETLPATGWKPVDTHAARVEGRTKLETLPDGWLQMQNTAAFGPRRRDLALRARLRFTGGEVWGLKIRSRMTAVGGDNYNAGISSDGASVRLLRRDYISGGGFAKNDAIIATAPLPRNLEKGEEFQLALAAVGDELAVYVNGQRLIHTRDPFCPGEMTSFGGSVICEYKDLEWLPLDTPASAPALDIAGLPPWRSIVFATLPPEEATQKRPNAAMEGSLLHLYGFTSWPLPNFRARNLALRITIAWRSGKSDARIRVRNQGDHAVKGDSLWAWITPGDLQLSQALDSKDQPPFKKFQFPVRPADNEEVVFEFDVVGRKAAVRWNGALLGVVEHPATNQAGGVLVDGKDLYVKKLEYIDLDTTPEDVALEKLGMTIVPPAGASTPAPSTAPAGATFTNDLGMKFVPVPITGGPTAGQRVLFSVWETRVRDYERFIADTNRNSAKAPYPQTPDHPAVIVDWNDANAFCAWLTERGRKLGEIKADESYRLPTDHEWSCAVGIGEREDPAASPADKDGKVGSVFPWGTGWPPPPNSGNYRGEELLDKDSNRLGTIAGFRDNFIDTAPVGESSAANGLGLFDLGGNVYEWCGDTYTHVASDPNHVLRGASFGQAGFGEILSSRRISRPVDYQSAAIGMRVVLAPASATLTDATPAFTGTPVKFWNTVESAPKLSGVILEDGILRIAKTQQIRHSGILFRNGTVRASILMSADPGQDQIHLRGLRDSDNKDSAYVLSLQRDRGVLVLMASPGPQLGEWKIPHGYRPGEWLKLEFTAIEDNLTVLADGVFEGSVRDKSIAGPGAINLYSSGGGSFRDLEFVSLDDPSPARTAGIQASGDWKPLFTSPETTVRYARQEQQPDGHLMLDSAFVVEPQPRADAAIRARIRVSLNSGTPALMLRHGAIDCYRCSFNREFNAILVDRFSAENPRTLANVRIPQPLKEGDIAELEFRAVGRDLSVYLNGTPAIQHRLDDASLIQGAGYWGASGWGKAIFEKVEGRSLSP